MKNIVVGSRVCPLYVKFKIVDESAEDVAAKAKALKKEIREGGRIYKNYPQSLFDEILSRSSDNLVFYRVHNFSRYAGVSENVEMLEFANFIFVTDPDKNPTITRDLLKYYDVDDLDSLARRILEINELKRVVVIPPSYECENLRFYQTDFNRCVEVKCPDSPRVRTAWLNGSCAALLLKDWQGNAPFELNGRFPKIYEDFERFADWAVQLAYQDDVKPDFKIAESWIIK